jgi:protein-S-isoprenylcysteine O-methyltransferase Ste14
MNGENILDALYWGLFVAMFAIRGWFAARVRESGETIRAEPGAIEREGFWPRALDRLFMLLAGVVALLWLCGADFRRLAIPEPVWLRWGGFGLGLASEGLFAWTHAVLGRLWSPYLQLRPGHELIMHGPYARIRHPIYAAILGWLASLGLIAANATPLFFAALGATIVLLRIAREEAMMTERFGDAYRAYRKRTGSLLPFWNSL